MRHTTTYDKETGIATIKGDNMRAIRLLNPDDRYYCRKTYMIEIGCYWGTAFLVYARCLQEAIDVVADYAREYAPGLLCTELVDEAYQEAIDDGMEPEEAWEKATEDCSPVGNYGDYILSWEWHGDELNSQQLQDVIQNYCFR